MRKTFHVTTISVNHKETIDVQKFEQDDMIGVARVLMTFKPKRGYSLIQYVVEPVETLV